MDKMVYNDHNIIGTKNALSNFKKILEKLGKGAGEHKQGDLLSDKYNIGDKVQILSTKKFGKIKKIENNKNKLYIEFDDRIALQSYSADKIKVISEDDDISDVEEDVEEEEEEEEDEEEPKINFKNVSSFLRNINEIPEDELRDLKIANDQILKCLGLL